MRNLDEIQNIFQILISIGNLIPIRKEYYKHLNSNQALKCKIARIFYLDVL